MTSEFPDLVRLFDSLPAPASDVGAERFCAQSVPGFLASAIGKDAGGYPVLLIQADDARPGTAAPLVLERLSVIHLVNCRMHHPARGEQEKTLSVIRCTEKERAFHEFFLRSLYPIIASLPERPSRQHISDAIERLVDLFRRLAEAPRKTIAGLWAELLLIAHAQEPSMLIRCWHSFPEERFDLVSGADRIDVKAALGGVRIHHFNLEQLRPAHGTQVMIASVMIERAEGGSSVADLVDAIRSRISDAEQLIRLDNVVAKTIGQDWRSTQQFRVDLEVAASSLRFFDAEAIPAVPVPLPPEVSDVRFRVDLSSHALLPPEQLIAGSRLFLAAQPRRLRSP